MIEYGIVFSGDDPNELYSGPMSKAEAQQWIDKVKEMVGSRGPVNFEIVHRLVTDWKYVD